MKDGPQGKEIKAGCEDPLLLWAVRDSNKRTFVHVGMLTSAEKGVACRCLCRGCNEPLIAINVDKSASHFEKPRAQRRHFKHRHSNSSESRCLSSVARFLALQLFVEQDSIYLPPRSRAVFCALPTGITVYAEQQTPGDLVQVRSRTWIDDVSAILSLEDGRELLVTVRAHQNIDDDRRSVCVLSLVGVCDPAIASWDSDKILKYLRLPGCGMEWDSHWDDSDLDAKKDGDLADQEKLFLGGIPKKWLDDLVGKQVNETVLHWLIKKTVAETGILKVPAFSISLRQEMPDKSIAAELATCRAGVLQLDDIRLERRFDTMVPDVMCRARLIGSNGPMVDLMIEAAVTNYIDDDKRKKIEASGVACIQIRADLFPKAGTVHSSEIEKIICSDASGKEWIVHPWIADEIAKAERRLNGRAKRIQDLIHAEVQAERDRERAERIRLEDRANLDSWLKSATDLALSKGYLKALKASWSGQPAPQVGTEPVALSDLWNELKRRKIVGANRQIVESSGNLLNTLVGINQEALDAKGTVLADLLTKAASHDRMAIGNALVIMFALKRNTSLMTPLQAEAFHEFCKRLHIKVQNCDDHDCRNTEHDRLYALLFPEIAIDLESDYGTWTHKSMLIQEREEQRAVVERHRKRRQTRLALAQALRDAKVKRVQTEAVAEVLATFSGRLGWVKRLLDGSGAGVLYGLYSGKVRLQDISAMDVIKTAITYRDGKFNVDAALKAMPFKDSADIPEAVRLLEISGLCTIRK